MGFTLSSLWKFPSFPPPSLVTGEWWEVWGVRRQSWLLATWAAWFLDILSLRQLWEAPLTWLLYFVRKKQGTGKHFHFSIIYFLDHPRQFKILGWLPCNAAHLGTPASCLFNMRAQECKVIFILAQVKRNSEGNSTEAKLSVVLPLPNTRFLS